MIDRKNFRNHRLVLGLMAARLLKPNRRLAISTVLDAQTASDTFNEELKPQAGGR